MQLSACVAHLPMNKGMQTSQRLGEYFPICTNTTNLRGLEQLQYTHTNNLFFFNKTKEINLQLPFYILNPWGWWVQFLVSYRMNIQFVCPIKNNEEIKIEVPGEKSRTKFSFYSSVKILVKVYTYMHGDRWKGLGIWESNLKILIQPQVFLEYVIIISIMKIVINITTIMNEYLILKWA